MDGYLLRGSAAGNMATYDMSPHPWSAGCHLPAWVQTSAYPVPLVATSVHYHTASHHYPLNPTRWDQRLSKVASITNSLTVKRHQVRKPACTH